MDDRRPPNGGPPSHPNGSLLSPLFDPSSWDLLPCFEPQYYGDMSFPPLETEAPPPPENWDLGALRNPLPPLDGYPQHEDYLEDYLTRLSLSSPAPPSRQSPYPVPAAAAADWYDLDWNRRRIEDAVRGLYPNHQSCQINNNQSSGYRPDHVRNSGDYLDYGLLDLCPRDYNFLDAMRAEQEQRDLFLARNPYRSRSFGDLCRPPRQFWDDFTPRPEYRRARTVPEYRSRERLYSQGNSNGQVFSSFAGGNGNRREQRARPQPPPRSPRATYSSLEEVAGRIFEVAKDQHGCRFLQSKFEEGKAEDVQMIFLEVKDRLDELMVDPFGNYLIQKLLDACSQEQITQIVLCVVNKDDVLLNICLDVHGTRVMQRLLEKLTTPTQKSILAQALRPLTLTLTKSLNGHHVIEHCFRHFSNADKLVLLNEFADNSLDVAMDKSGCCVLQQCVSNAEGEPRDRLVAEIASNAFILSEHHYGNYVLQFLLNLKISTDDISVQLLGKYVSLSMNRCGSNVVQACIRNSTNTMTQKIIYEIVSSPNFLMVIQDQFGNFVVQSALKRAEGNLLKSMTDLINYNYQFLHSHPFGKRVLEFLKGGCRKNRRM